MFPNSFKSLDGLNLACYGIQPSAGASRASVILIHGLGDHSRSLPYRNLADFLRDHGFSVYSFDWRGHGGSEGPRMYTNTWRNLRDDLEIFVELVHGTAPDKPLFLIGLSLGGLLVLNYAQHNPNLLKGLVAVAPAVDASGVPPSVKLIVPVLSRIMPRATINPGLDLAHISRDANAVNEYVSDPDFQTRTTPRLAGEVLKAMVETQAKVNQLNLPLLILHGAEDTIVKPAGSAAFFEQVPSRDKERRTYEGAYHNLFIEINRSQVFTDIASWLERHTQ